MMKTKTILFFVLLFGVTTSFILKSVTQSNTGPHGGRMQKAENFFIESQSNSSEYYIYLFNAKNKPIKNKGISCEIEFLFPDNTSLVFPLKPHEEDGFSLESSISGHQSYRVTFIVFGKTISSIFENETVIAKKVKHNK